MMARYVPLLAVVFSFFLQLALAIELTLEGPFGSRDQLKLSWSGLPPFSLLILSSEGPSVDQEIHQSYEGLGVLEAVWFAPNLNYNLN